MRKEMKFCFLLILIMSSSARQDGENLQQQQQVVDQQNVNFDDLKGQVPYNNVQPDEVSSQWDEDFELSLNFEEAYAQILGEVQEHCTNLNNFYDIKSQELADQRAKLEEKQSELSQVNEFIAWIEKKIGEDKEKIEQIYEDRCQAHIGYILFAKNSKITLRLLQFLREAVQNYSGEQLGALAQILVKYSTGRLFTSLSNDKALELMMAELKQVDQDQYKVEGDYSFKKRTAEEIGDKHIDDNREQIDVKDFDSRKERDLESHRAEILKLIDDLEANVKQQLEDRVNGEIDLNEKVIEYTNILEAEIQQLTKASEEQYALQGELETAIDDLNESITGGQNDLDWLVEQKNACTDIQANLINNKAGYQAKWDELHAYEEPPQNDQDGEGVVDPQSGAIGVDPDSGELADFAQLKQETKQ